MSRALGDVGVSIDPLEYASFAEAMVPVEFESAWGYANRTCLEVICELPSQDQPSYPTKPLSDIAELRSREKAAKFLDLIVHDMRSQVGGGFHFDVSGPLGLVITANSD